MSTTAIPEQSQAGLEDAGARLARLGEVIEHAAHLLPAQGPITVFIHHNALHAFEDLPFHEAVKKAARVFGCQSYLSEDRYREALNRGWIRASELQEVLEEDLGAGAAAPVPCVGTRLGLRLARLQYPLASGSREELVWYVAEANALRRVRPEASSAVRGRLLAETRRWVMRDLRGNGDEPADRAPAGLAELLGRFGESAMENWSDDDWEGFTLQALWRICCAGVRDLPPFTDPPAPAARHRDSAYNCGACGGSAGGPNGRAIAQVLNDPRVRAGLAARGLAVPAGTAFLGGYHDTCNDSIVIFDRGRLPPEHRAGFEAASEAIEAALDRNAHQRCRRFMSAPLTLSFRAARLHVEERSEDLAQTRPELGHATNAITIVGRREWSRRLFLDRGAFLTSYDPSRDDADGSILTRILQAVYPVCAGINLGYFFSHVDNDGFGAGTKLPHNLAAMVGVMDGPAGDLRTGLPWQMMEIHEPVRSLFIIEATPELMTRIMDRVEMINRISRNGWVQLAVIHPETRAVSVFRDGSFRPYEPHGDPFPRRFRPDPPRPGGTLRPTPADGLPRALRALPHAGRLLPADGPGQRRLPRHPGLHLDRVAGGQRRGGQPLRRHRRGGRRRAERDRRGPGLLPAVHRHPARLHGLAGDRPPRADRGPDPGGPDPRRRPLPAAGRGHPRPRRRGDPGRTHEPPPAREAGPPVPHPGRPRGRRAALIDCLKARAIGPVSDPGPRVRCDRAPGPSG